MGNNWVWVWDYRSLTKINLDHVDCISIYPAGDSENGLYNVTAWFHHENWYLLLNVELTKAKEFVDSLFALKEKYHD